MDNIFNSLNPSDDSTLWRFIDLFKFVDLITSKKLALANLTVMKDPYEGVLHQSIKIQFVDVNNNPSESNENDDNIIQILNNSTRKILFISCWHENEFESAGMWHGNENGIAIKTTVSKLKKSMKYHDYVEMDLLKVNYYKSESDYFIPNRTESHHYTGLINKRVSFEHEKEVRLIWHPRDYENNSPIRKIDIDIKELIECIYVSPLFDEWQLNSLKEMIRQLGLNIPIKKSVLYELK